MKVAFKNITDKECNLLSIKLYLYLGHNYMDLHCYDRAITYAHKCRFFCADAEEPIRSEVNLKKKIMYLVVKFIYFLFSGNGTY